MKEFNIDELLEKYFDGDTSLDEEIQLKEFFSQSVVPDKYEKFAGHFRFLVSDSKEYPDDDFNVSVARSIEKSKIYRTNLVYKIGYTIAAVAAVIAILIMAYVQYSSLPNKSLRLDFLSQDTYKDPELAYTETKRTLLFVSAEMNKGMEKLSDLSKFNQSINELEKLSEFNKYQSMFFKGENGNEN